MVTATQQEVLEQAAMRPITRWTIESRLFKSFDAAVRKGLLTDLGGGWFRLSDKGREAIR